ncbi:MAG: hypothetical protein ABFR89_13285 [Actinomycetota bacterium]
MKRFGILLLVVGTAMVMALPAGAKKPVPPAPYSAEITFTGANGVATDCSGPIDVMRTDAPGGVTHYESTGAELRITAEGLTLEECHGSVQYPEYFRITFDGPEIAMLWIFDVEVVDKPVTFKNGKVRIKEVRTDFRMGGPYDGDDFAEWTVGDEGVITAAGTFSFVQYDSSRDPLFVSLENGLQEFDLAITLTPSS